MGSFFKRLFKKEVVTVVVPETSIVPVIPAHDEPARLDLSRGIALIKEFEGCVLSAYPDPGSGGAPWTIGWGHTGPDVYQGKVITQEEADRLFEQDIQPRVMALKGMITREYTSGQFCALLSFAYNCGLGALQNSTLLRLFNVGEIAGAAEQFQYWNRGAKGVLPGLVRRRSAEKELFLS